LASEIFSVADYLLFCFDANNPRAILWTPVPETIRTMHTERTSYDRDDGHDGSGDRERAEGGKFDRTGVYTLISRESVLWGR
jgi:hypothetical protein